MVNTFQVKCAWLIEESVERVFVCKLNEFVWGRDQIGIRQIMDSNRFSEATILTSKNIIYLTNSHSFQPMQTTNWAPWSNCLQKANIATTVRFMRKHPLIYVRRKTHLGGSPLETLHTLKHSSRLPPINAFTDIHAFQHLQYWSCSRGRSEVWKLLQCRS